ncbi:MAG TPA: hypothetical protein VGC41_12060 [Kofleriaceae bacterium]
MRYLAFALLVACSGKETGGHCTLGNACEDYGEQDLAGHEKDCKQLTGTWAKGSCPSADRIGTCTTEKNVQRSYYKGGANAFTLDQAEASCEHEFHGTFKK